MGTVASRLTLVWTGISDYLELTRPRIVLLVLITAFVGFCLGSDGSLDLAILVHALAGTALVGGGTIALNQFLERESDARMRRTQDRPLPAGRMRPGAALFFGIAASALGLVYLALAVGLLTSALGAVALGVYVFLYTPLKKVTPLCVAVGAVSGAIPPMMGWTAARGALSFEAWILFAILFLWQFPHFLAIAWLYREEYTGAGYRMLPTFDPGGRILNFQLAMGCLVLLPVSLAPTFLGLAGTLYTIGALALGLGFLVFAVRFALSRSHARRLLHASLVYLPALLALMMLDRPSL